MSATPWTDALALFNRLVGTIMAEPHIAIASPRICKALHEARRHFGTLNLEDARRADLAFEMFDALESVSADMEKLGGTISKGVRSYVDKVIAKAKDPVTPEDALFVLVDAMDRDGGYDGDTEVALAFQAASAVVRTLKGHSDET